MLLRSLTRTAALSCLPLALLTSAHGQATALQLYQQADAEVQEGKYAEGLAKYEQLLTLLTDPQMQESLHYSIALAHLLSKDYPKSETAFQTYLEKFPQGPNAARANLGLGRSIIAQENESKRDAAVAALSRAAEDSEVQSEAVASLANLLVQMGRNAEALQQFQKLTGAEVYTAQQTSAALEVIKLLAESEQLDQLVPYIHSLPSQAGVRNSIAWFSNELAVLGGALTDNEKFEAALAVYRAAPTRQQILDTQTASLEAAKALQTSQEAQLELLQAQDANATTPEARQALAEARDRASRFISDSQEVVRVAEAATKAIEEEPDFDAIILMQRGACLYYMDRREEALICFRQIRTNFPDSKVAERAAFAEVSTWSGLGNTEMVDQLAKEFVEKYPESENREVVSALVLETLARQGAWPEVQAGFQKLEADFPESQNKDRYRMAQGVAIMEQGNFQEAAGFFLQFLKDFPDSQAKEEAMFRVIIARFFNNEYAPTLQICEQYLTEFPNGRFEGEVRYRLAFIEFNDPEAKPQDIIDSLNAYLSDHQADPSKGAMLALIGDIYSQKMDPADPGHALESYKRVVLEAPATQEETIRYALGEATTILSADKRWEEVAALHEQVIQRLPNTQLALYSVGEVAKMKIRLGKPEEATALITEYLRASIADPTKEEVEPLIMQLIEPLLPPRRERANADLDALDANLQAALAEAARGQENPTTFARTMFGRAALARALGKNDIADEYMKSTADQVDDVTVLSPILLAQFGEILLKSGDLERAEGMFARLTNRFQLSPYGSAGPVGQAQVQLARGEYEEALKAFDKAIENATDGAALQNATLGRLEALLRLEKYEDEPLTAEEEKLPPGPLRDQAVARHRGAISQAEAILADRGYRGEPAGRTYITLARLYQTRAASESGDAKKETLAKANGYFQNAYLRFQAFPEIAAAGYWGSYEVLNEMGKGTEAEETLRRLAEDKRLENTEEAQRARREL